MRAKLALVKASGPELSTVQEIWQSKPGSQHSGAFNFKVRPEAEGVPRRNSSENANNNFVTMILTVYMTVMNRFDPCN